MGLAELRYGKAFVKTKQVVTERFQTLRARFIAWSRRSDARRLLLCSLLAWASEQELGRSCRQTEAIQSRSAQRRVVWCLKFDASLLRRGTDRSYLWAKLLIQRWSRYKARLRHAELHSRLLARLLTVHSLRLGFESWLGYLAIAVARKRHQEMATLLAQAGAELARASAGTVSTQRFGASTRLRLRRMAGVLVSSHWFQCTSRAFTAWMRCNSRARFRQVHSEA